MKLNKDQQKTVDEAETLGGVMDEAIYTMRLVEVKSEPGKSGPLWLWVFQVPEDTEEEHAKKYKKWKQFLRTSLSEKAAWKLKEVFEAFGKSTDTDTDELIGGLVRVAVSQQTIQEGKRAGEVGTQVDKVLPLDPAAKAASGKGAGSKSDKALF